MRDTGICDAQIKGSHTRREENRDCHLFIQQIRSNLSGFLSDDSSAYTMNLKRDVTDVAPVWWHVYREFSFIITCKIETAMKVIND